MSSMRCDRDTSHLYLVMSAALRSTRKIAMRQENMPLQSAETVPDHATRRLCFPARCPKTTRTLATLGGITLLACQANLKGFTRPMWGRAVGGPRGKASGKAVLGKLGGLR